MKARTKIARLFVVLVESSERKQAYRKMTGDPSSPRDFQRATMLPVFELVPDAAATSPPVSHAISSTVLALAR